jgi:hypothetical protein
MLCRGGSASRPYHTISTNHVFVGAVCFLAEFVRACSNETLTILAGGDFNIIRNPLEKSNDRFDSIWPTLFNACIESLSLRVSTDTTFTLHTPSLIVVVAGRGALGPHDAPSSLYLAMGAARGVLGPRDRPFSVDSVVGAAKGVLEQHEIPS